MTLTETVHGDQRLLMLQALERAEGYELNERVLRAAVEELGHHPGSDLVRSHLLWLERQGLVTVEHLPMGTGGAVLWVAKLTASGADVAGGAMRVHGVARPGPAG